MRYHLHMPSYFLRTFTEYPFLVSSFLRKDTLFVHMDEYIAILLEIFHLFV